MPLRTRDFLQLVKDLLPALLPPTLADFQSRIVFTSLQVYYWNPRIHYEVWPVRKTGCLEIGLHFEADREESYRWAEVLAERALAIQAELGPQTELEAWTPAWTRLHLTLPLAELDDELAGAAAQKLAAIIVVLQPILEEERANVALPKPEGVASQLEHRHRPRYYHRHRHSRGAPRAR